MRFEEFYDTLRQYSCGALYVEVRLLLKRAARASLCKFLLEFSCQGISPLLSHEVALTIRARAPKKPPSERLPLYVALFNLRSEKSKDRSAGVFARAVRLAIAHRKLNNLQRLQRNNSA